MHVVNSKCSTNMDAVLSILKRGILLQTLRRASMSVGDQAVQLSLSHRFFLTNSASVNRYWFRYFGSSSETIVIFFFRLRRSYTQYNSISDEDAYRRQSREEHHNKRSQESPASIVDISGQLIRLCGNALCSTIHSAGDSMADFIRSLIKNQNEKEKDLGLVLVILITIIASLMMLVFNGDRSIHHHHWDYFNPPDNSGKLWIQLLHIQKMTLNATWILCGSSVYSKIL